VAVGFWQLDSPSATTAVVSADGRRLSYGDLREASDSFAETLASREKGLGFVLCRNTPNCLIAYLGALRSGTAACLLDGDISGIALARLVDEYSPDWLFLPEPMQLDGYLRQERAGGILCRRIGDTPDAPINPELALLLPTSGSTGSPKLVRLSYKNLQANACSIVSCLGITPDDRCITSMPMAYSYGLSVLQTHLLAGAQLLMTTSGFLQRDFWKLLRDGGATSLAGVPYHYEVMLSRRLLDQELSSIRTLTQAGGRLSPERIEQVQAIAARRGWRFFVMYGQTEATARIAYVPTERLHEKIGSIGIAVPEGCLSLDSETGELVYEGPNVMLGYAERRADLGKGDELSGRLPTGDLAGRDNDGFYYIRGRLKRFVKIFGRRFNLDDIETFVSTNSGGSVACFGSDDQICVAIDRESSEEVVVRIMHVMLKIHPSAFRIVRLHSIPRLANGKLDYRSLGELAHAS
jgi:acyl-CoA synthetase (AMP-forming)/AMP-acid ligase II